METIVASGAFLAAASFVELLGMESSSGSAEVVRSRAASVTGDLELMRRHAHRAAELDPGSDTVAMNLITSHFVGGDILRSVELAERLSLEGKSDLMRDIAAGVRLNIAGSLDGVCAISPSTCSDWLNGIEPTDTATTKASAC